MKPIEKIYNAYIVPYLINKDIFKGGIKNDTKFGRIERKKESYASEFDGNSPFVTEKPMDKTGKFLFAGPLYNHFGHIMTESIHRLYAYNEKYDGVVFVATAFSYKSIQSTKVPNYLYEITDLFNVPKEKIIIVRGATTFEELDVYKPGSYLMRGAEDWYLNLLTNKINIESNCLSIKKIYLGRLHLLAQGSILGESYFFNKFIENGFVYIAPEQYTIREQMSLMKNAEEIVLLEGSSIYSLELLSKTKAKIYYMPRRNYDTFFRPHLENKSVYNLVGDLKNIVRLKNNDGQLKPSSPVILRDPLIAIKSLYDLAVLNNIDYSFDTYFEYIKIDLLNYVNGNSIDYENYLSLIKTIMKDGVIPY